jgi:hypothetical protein
MNRIDEIEAQLSKEISKDEYRKMRIGDIAEIRINAKFLLFNLKRITAERDAAVAELRRLEDENASLRNWNACEKELMDQYRNDSKRLIEVDAELSALKEANRWIPVSEKLPEDLKKVLVRTHVMIDTAEVFRGNGRAQWLWYGYEIPVLYWHPLPEAPESEEK